MVDEKRQNLKKIFANMSEEDVLESTNDALEWLKSKENKIFAYTDKPTEAPSEDEIELKDAYGKEVLCKIYKPDLKTIETILDKAWSVKSKWINIDPLQRAKLIYNLGDEIQKSQKLFCQLELLARGILSKDTKNKALPLLTDYVQYYSGYSVKSGQENPPWTPNGLLVAIFSDETSLFSLGCVLGPALAAGYNIILYSGHRFTLLATLVNELAVKVGIPEGTIRIIPEGVDVNDFNRLLSHKNTAAVSIFDNVFQNKCYVYPLITSMKLIHFPSSVGTSMVVFEGADLDSACHSAVEAAWGYRGMLPWSLRKILVQESQLKPFVEKLKDTVSLLRVAKGMERNVDVALPFNETALNRLKQIVADARSQGLEVFPNRENVEDFTPMLLIGGEVYTNNVRTEDLIDVPVVTVVAFRSINEAVALANNTRRGLAVSVWSESNSLNKEVAMKLKVSNVWVNCNGLFAADVPFSSHNNRGSYFGGRQGYCEYILREIQQEELTDIVRHISGPSMDDAIGAAKKAQTGWAKLTGMDRMRKLLLVAQTISSNMKELIEQKLPEASLRVWVDSIYQYNSSVSGEGSKIINSFSVESYREAVGVIVIESDDEFQTDSNKLILTALGEGNAVIMLSDSREGSAFYSLFRKHIPKDIFAVLPRTYKNREIALTHKMQGNTSVLPLFSSKFNCPSNDWNGVLQKTTIIKNVWTSLGQSFI